MGARLLKNVEISEVISARLTETAMSADEVLMRLADHARGSMADFVRVTPAGPVFDFQAAETNGKLNLIKKLKTKTKIYVDFDKDPDNDDLTVEIGQRTEIDVELELYDAQAALEKLGRHHKLFTDKTELTGKDSGAITVKGYVKFSPDDWDED